MRCAAAIAVVITVGLGYSSRANASASPVASIISRAGALYIARSGASISGIEHDALFPRDVVSTGSDGRADILFNDGSQVYLNHDTKLMLTGGSEAAGGHQVLFHLLSGQVFVRSRPNHVVWTPAALIAVRGTEFQVAVAPDDVATVRVSEGAVEFYNSFGSVVVGSGQQSHAAPGSAPTPPVVIPAGELTYEWTFDISRSRIDREEWFISHNPASLTTLINSLGAAPNRSPDSLLELGDALSDAGRYNQAAASYSASLTLATSANALIHLGYAYLHLDRIDDAGNAFARALPDPRASLGEAWIALRDHSYAEALRLASPAAQTSSSNTDEAQLIDGIAQTLSPDNRAAGERTLLGLTRQPASPFGAQASAWLSLAEVADGNAQAALANARQAAGQAPWSPTAHAALAVACFDNGLAGEAAREARIAGTQDPRDPLSATILAETFLASNRPMEAARTAARAAAVDPVFPEPYCVLAASDFALGDYVHADLDLGRALAVAPEYPPAIVALAKLDNARGETGKAEALLRTHLAANPNSADLHEALAQIYYAKSRYSEAVSEYKIALRLRPNSATAAAGLARAALDAGDLPDAIPSGQLAVALAPDISQFHSLLGLIYQYAFSKEETVSYEPRSEAEYREALALDPKNGLARAQLALQEFNGPGDQNSASNISSINLTSVAQGNSVFTDPGRQQGASNVLADTIQASLNDQSTIPQLFRGGVGTQITGQTDTYDKQLNGVHRDNFANGAIQDFLQYRSDTSYPSPTTGGNDESAFGMVRAAPISGVTVMGIWLHEKQDELFPLQSGATPEQATTGDYAAGVAGVKLADSVSVWGGLDGLFTTENYTNPSANAPVENASTGSVGTEARADFRLGSSGSHSPNLTIGVAKAPQQANEYELEYLIPIPGFPATSQNRLDLLHSETAYAQLQQNVTRRLSYVAAVEDVWANATSTPDSSAITPALEVGYQVDRGLTARFTAGREQGATTIAVLEPRDALAGVEPLALPIGYALQTDVYEGDLEKYFRSNLIKIYTFQSLSRQLTFGQSMENLAFPLTDDAERVVRHGTGVRIEHAFSNSIYASLDACGSETNNDQLTESFGASTLAALLPGRVPYNPERTATLNLSYIDNHRDAFSVEARYDDLVWNQQTVNVNGLATTQSSWYPAQTYVDFRISKEPTLWSELFVQVDNAFSSHQIQFNSLPVNLATVEAGATLRF